VTTRSGIILRFVLATALAEFFAYTVLDPYYLRFMSTEEGLAFTPSEFGLFVSLGAWTVFVTDYPSGAVADKLGRRTCWALSMFFYSAAMLWLCSVASPALAMGASVLMGLSWAFSSGSKEAWLYDFVGKEGMREAYGKLYLFSVPLKLLGVVVATAVGLLGSVRAPILLVAVVMLLNGLLILTFPENYGGGGSGWLAVMRRGASRFLRDRILQLLALQSFFMILPLWINSAWWYIYLVKEFNPELPASALAFGATAVAAAVVGLHVSAMRVTDYRLLLLIPTATMAVACALMPWATSPWLLVALASAAIACSYYRGSGITILANERISEERATALSVLSALNNLYWAVGSLMWSAVIESLGLRQCFLLAGAMSLASLGVLTLAVSWSQRENTKV